MLASEPKLRSGAASFSKSAKACRMLSDDMPILRLTLALPARAMTLCLTYFCRASNKPQAIRAYAPAKGGLLIGKSFV